MISSSCGACFEISKALQVVIVQPLAQTSDESLQLMETRARVSRILEIILSRYYHMLSSPSDQEPKTESIQPIRV